LRSQILLGIVVAACLVLFVMTWRDAFEWQGLEYAFAMLAWNVLALMVVSALLWRALRSPSPFANLAFHVALFGWIAWCSFPWMGETP
jgi:hypothetical protein